MQVPKCGLLVDDEAHIRIYMRTLLGSLGVEEILEADRGEEALKVFEERKPDFVLLDINMPGMTGIEILKVMTTRNPSIPVIMLTGQASREAVENCRDAGAAFFIRKDTSKTEITSMLLELFAALSERNND